MWPDLGGSAEIFTAGRRVVGSAGRRVGRPAGDGPARVWAEKMAAAATVDPREFAEAWAAAGPQLRRGYPADFAAVSAAVAAGDLESGPVRAARPAPGLFLVETAPGRAFQIDGLFAEPVGRPAGRAAAVEAPAPAVDVAGHGRREVAAAALCPRRRFEFAARRGRDGREERGPFEFRARLDQPHTYQRGVWAVEIPHDVDRVGRVAFPDGTAFVVGVRTGGPHHA